MTISKIGSSAQATSVAAPDRQTAFGDYLRSAPPADLPRLQAGAHVSAQDGACLMELVSVLAEQKFSDRPRCTEPLLAHLARLVNDASSDVGRPQLALLARALTSAGPTGAVGAAVRALAAVQTAAVEVPATDEWAGRRLARISRRAHRHLQRVNRLGPAGVLTRRLELLHRHGPGRVRLERAVRTVTRIQSPERDRVLAAMLKAALAAGPAGAVPRAIPGVAPQHR
jgi:hypothetical protein